MTTKWLPTSEKERLGVVIHNFHYDGEYCLQLDVGDTVHNLRQEEHWYFGYSVRNRALKGIYPKSYVHIKDSVVEKTAAGEQVIPRQAPVVQEVTCVLREWGQIGQELYRTHDKRWQAVYLLMRDLMTSRSKMLTGTLTLDEQRDLKFSLTNQIDFGNNLLGLDMVVRDEQGNILSPDSTSVVKLYQEHEKASQRVKKNATSSSASTALNGKVKLSNRHSHMFFVAVRNFVCRIGEDTELMLCLYDAKEWRPLTENYVLRWSRLGLTMDLDLLGNMRVLYTDLGSQDLNREKVYLVCYVVRIGNMDVRPDEPKKSMASSSSSSAASRRTTITSSPSSGFSPEFLRRPCGIACVDVSDYLNGTHETDEDKQHFVPFIACSDSDSLDGTLRRLIASGREVSHKEHKNQGLWVSLRLLHGDLKQVSEEHPALVQVSQLAVCRKLGFPEIILPGDVRHDLYLTLSSGEFSRGSAKKSDKNVEVTVKVCNEKGKPIPGVMHLGSGVTAQDEYRSVVYYHEGKPRWNETFKIAIPIDEFYSSHLKFTFKHRSSNEAKDRTEKPFGMSYVKLMQENGTTLMDTLHELLVYKIDHKKLDENDTSYLELPSTRSELGESSSSSSRPTTTGLVLNTKDSLLISSCLCSTKLTQNVDLLGLLKYQSSQSQHLPDILAAFMKVDSKEVVKFLQDVLDALFNILMLNSDSDAFDRSVFDCLVFIIGLVTDRNYEHFKPVLDVYIKDNFSATLAYRKLLVVLDHCVRSEVTSKAQADDLLRIMKSVQYLFKFVVRSRQLFEALYGKEEEDEEENDFERLLLALLTGMAEFMKRTDELVLLAQGACVKYMPCAIPDLLLIVDDQQLSTALTAIVTSIPAGKLSNVKMAALNSMVHSQLFLRPECRAIILPVVVRRVKELLSGQHEVSSSVTIMCDVMEILNRRDVGSTHNDVAQVMTNGLRTVIQTIINTNREDALVGRLVSIMLAIFGQMTPHHYRNYLGGFGTRTDLLDFLIEILMVFKDLVAKPVYPADWAQMALLQNSIILKALRLFSHTIRDRFSDPYEGQLWNNYFHCSIAFVTQPALQLESFSQTKRRQILTRYKDMRREMGLDIRTMWINLGQNKINFVPGMVGQFLEMTLLPETELRKATIPMFFDMMQCEFYAPKVHGESYSETKKDPSHIKGHFHEVEDKLITELDVLVEGGRGDEHYKDLFESIMGDLCENHTTLREPGLKLVRTVTRLMERLLEYRSIITDENRENRMSCTVNLLNFYQDIGRKEMYIRYLNKLCDLHLECDNFTEAASTLQLHAQLLRWSDEPLSALLLTPRHPGAATHRQLKEALYLDSIDLFDRGKMWECALTLCKELAKQYEDETYDYIRLSALLNRMATMYDSIIKQMRPEPEYFRVAFYGRGFPAFLQNKVFVFRGKEYERLGDFTNRILLQFPNAETMNKLTPPDREIMDSPQQYLQINKVDAMLASEDEERFASKPVNEQILRFYRVNQVRKFSFSRPFHRGQRDSDNAFSSLWLERTILSTSQPLPGILRWFPVVETQVFQLSPLETAIETMEAANKSLTDMVLSYKADTLQPLHPLSMKLNGIVDAAVNGGINNYEKAFFTERYLIEHPGDGALVDQLKDLFARQIPLLDAALSVHRTRVNSAMQPLHQRIEDCFARMRHQVEDKYGRREMEPQLERQLSQIARHHHGRSSTGSTTGTVHAAVNRLSTNSADASEKADATAAPLPAVSMSSRLSNMSSQSFSAGSSPGPRQMSAVSLFSRGSSQALSSFSFSLPSTPSSSSSSPSSGAPSSASPSSKMLGASGGGGGGRFKTSKTLEKKLRDKENKPHRDSFRRLSSSSVGRSSPFASLSLAGFGIGGGSGPSSPAVTGTNTPTIGSSRNSLDASSSSEAVNSSELASPTTPVIELTQHLTAKRPLRSEAIRERRSSATSRGATASMNGAGATTNDGLVTSSPSQNSIASTLSSTSTSTSTSTSSGDDVPPPLPAKQQSMNFGSAATTGADGPPEKPPHPANLNLGAISPPPPPPKKPSRPLPPL